MFEDISIYAVLYILFSICIIFPPTEFISAGLTLNSLFAFWLGDETKTFVEYHLRRSVLNVIAHSCLPLGFLLLLHCCSESDDHVIGHLLTLNWRWRLFVASTLLLPVTVSSLVYYLWLKRDWFHHPLVDSLRAYDSTDWRRVAQTIDVEYRRLDRFTVTMGGIKRVVVTDSWIVMVGSYFVRVSQQADSRLTVISSDEHHLSPISRSEIQFVKIRVENFDKPTIAPFFIRMTSTEYRELCTKLQAPVEIARDVVIHLSLNELFVESFRLHAEANPRFEMSEPHKEMLDNCIGCMQVKADVKLEKHCVDSAVPDQMDEDGHPIPNCRQCYCRPMWCLSCMGRWFASRQKQQNPETWLSGKSPCPTCRAPFCMLDVCIVR